MHFHLGVMFTNKKMIIDAIKDYGMENKKKMCSLRRMIPKGWLFNVWQVLNSTWSLVKGMGNNIGKYTAKLVIIHATGLHITRMQRLIGLQKHCKYP